MAKAPVAGRSKTRLARDIGVGAAVAFARHGRACLVKRLAADPRWTTLVSVSPDTARSEPIWPRGVPLLAQGRGSLGARMQRIFMRLPPGPVVIVGTDIPGIRPQHIAHAFRVLDTADAVFGPATDGGYWLVGLKRRPHCARPFGEVRWSSPHALADTLANLAGCTIGFVATLDDVDDAPSLRRSAHCTGRVVPASRPATCYKTASPRQKEH